MTRNPLRTAVILTALSIAIAACFSYAVHLNSTAGAYTCSKSAVIVEQGDSMHEIVQRYCSGNLVNAVDDLVIGYGTSDIYPGEELRLVSKP